ncbi:DUF4133 domain-containing protein [Pedobacter frigoris]|uniref:DUF4133 domain-containing protein n=1 Tax=Pedobacter frigoris TaxID=2571272 RepID=UPI00292CE836|nr:DUF4133 domain-containing protein [Pedobacter frigoris]
MANSVYQINKGINRSIEFRGLKAQYIAYMAVGLLALLIVYAILYIIGVNAFICIGIIVTGGTYLVIKVNALSKKYGEYGMMKMVAKKQVPDVVKNNTRDIFKFDKN